MALPSILRLWSLRLGLAVAVLDFAWARSMLSLVQDSNPASTVRLTGAVVWIFLHLPAALLAGLPFQAPASPSEPLPPAELGLMALLGAAQMGALAWWLGRRLDKDPKGKP